VRPKTSFIKKATFFTGNQLRLSFWVTHQKSLSYS